MSLTGCLYLERFRRYDEKCIFDLDGAVDLDLDPISTKSRSGLESPGSHIWYAFGVDTSKTFGVMTTLISKNNEKSRFTS